MPFVTLYFANVPERMLLFGESYVADPLAVLLKLFGFLTIAVALLYSRDYLNRRGMMRGEYYVLALTSLLGIFVLISANSLLTVYIGVELMSLSLYAMVAFDRDNGVAAESAMKYFVLGAIASGMLLYGMSLIYGMTGTLMLDDLAAIATGDTQPRRHPGSRVPRRRGAPSSSAPFRSTCGCPTFIPARPRP